MRNNSEDFEQHYSSAKDGLMLAGRLYGWQNKDNCPVVCLTDHARNGSDFHELALYLASEAGSNRRVLALDYRGRGKSEFDKRKDNYVLPTEADDVLSYITALNIGHFDLIGSARGGMIAMMLGGMRAGSLNKIILNDIGPAIDARGLVHIKKLYEQFSMCKSMQQIETVLVKFGERHFPALPQFYWALEAKRLFDDVDGKLVTNNDPYVSSLISGINLDARPTEMWEQFIGIRKFPLMLVRGALSDLLPMETVKKMQAIHKTMEFVQVEGQGHAPKLETGDLPQTIADFLNK